MTAGELFSALEGLGAARAGDADHRARWGQHFTPAEIARFMASLVEVEPGRPLRVLDPGAGVGVLGIAAACSALERGASSVHLIAVEPEPRAREGLADALAWARALLGDRLQVELREDDLLAGPWPGPVDLVIANPPWYKMSPRDGRGGEAPNAYARFLARGRERLVPGGQMVYLIPRSFASGAYFRRFRASLHQDLALLDVHLFGSRRASFRGVLQESLIARWRASQAWPERIRVGSSAGPQDLGRREVIEVPSELVRDLGDPGSPLVFPHSADERALLARASGWSTRLHTLGLQVRTGPIVPFRTSALRAEGGAGTAPMLWMQHVRAGALRWPLGPSLGKPEHVRLGEAPLIPNRGCVLVRRFSAREDARRLVACWVPPGALGCEQLGVENHLNVITAREGEMDPGLGEWLAAQLGGEELEALTRMRCGSTQVGAAELRALALPGR